MSNEKKESEVLPVMNFNEFIARLKAPPRRWTFCVALLAVLYRLAVMAGVIFLVKLALVGSAGWLFLILPVALVFLLVAPSFPKE